MIGKPLKFPGKCLSQNCQEPCLTVTGGSDEWTDDAHVALHPLSAAEHYAKRLNRTCLPNCTKVRNAQRWFGAWHRPLKCIMLGSETSKATASRSTFLVPHQCIGISKVSIVMSAGCSGISDTMIMCSNKIIQFIIGVFWDRRVYWQTLLTIR